MKGRALPGRLAIAALMIGGVVSQVPAADKPPAASQHIQTGNIGPNATVSIRQTINQRDPAMAKVLDMFDRKDQELKGANEKNRALEEELAKLRAEAALRIVEKAQSPSATSRDKQARNAFVAGDTRLAEALLEREAVKLAGEGKLRLAEAAQRERELAALASTRSIGRAVKALGRAAELEPDNALNWLLLGDAEVTNGRLAGALAAYRRGLEIAQRLAGRDGENTEWQRDLSVSHDKIGNILVAQGDLTGALAAYRRGLEIAQRLAGRDGENTEWQRDLSVSHDKIGNILVAQGDSTGALAAYRRGLEIAQRLAGRDGENTQWQRDLSVSHNKIGDILVAQGDLTGALAAYRRGLDIAQRLSGRDAANAQWQSDLVVSYWKIASLYLRGGTAEQARRYLAQGLDLLRKLDQQSRLLPTQQSWIRKFSDAIARLEG